MKDYSKTADNYFDNTGLLKQYPAKKPVGEIVLQRFADLKKNKKKKTDKEEKQKIREHIAFSDIELIRRERIEYAFLNRERNGSQYWMPQRIYDITED